MNAPHRDPTVRADRLLAVLTWLALAPAPRAQGPDPAADDFEHHQLGPSWAVYVPASGIVGDSDLGTYASGCAVGWVSSTFGADQFSQASTSSNGDPNMLEQVFARKRASDNARYGFHFNGDFANSQWEIKYDGVPSAKTKLLAVLVGPPPAQTDTLRIEAFGTDPVQLRGYVNGALKLAAADGSPERIKTPGPCGVVARMEQGTVNQPPTPIFEDWSGGSLHWIDLGNGLAGAAGIPMLTGTGSLEAGTTAVLSLSNALPSGIAALVAGATQVNAPLLGGVLVPSPDVVVPSLPIDASGSWSLSLEWPAPLASGFAMAVQMWVKDPAGPEGFAASNGLLITTQ